MGARPAPPSPQREPVSRPVRHARPLLALAFVAALVARRLHPARPRDHRRGARGVRRRAKTRSRRSSRCRGGGRLLVESDAGPGSCSADGSKRLLGALPRGVVVAVRALRRRRASERARRPRARTARPLVARAAGRRLPRWGGSAHRHAHRVPDRRPLHVVAGDGTGDVDAGGLPTAAPVAPAWRPGPRHVVAYARRRRARLRVRRRRRSPLAVGARSRGRAARVVERRQAARARHATTRSSSSRADDGRLARRPLPARTSPTRRSLPERTTLALVRAREVLVARRGDVLAAGRSGSSRAPGVFDDVAWSPDGRWLLVGWRERRPMGVRSRRGRAQDRGGLAGLGRSSSSTSFPRSPAGAARHAR